MKIKLSNLYSHLQIALFTAVFCLSGCTERIDIKTEDAAERLVIYGYITSDTTQHTIRITRSAGYFATTPQVGVSHAQVVIRSNNELIPLTESAETPGLYLTESNIYGTEGETYTLEVLVDFDDDGQTETFEAVSAMPYTSELDSITLVPSTLFDNLIEVQLYGKLPPDQLNYCSYHASRNSKIINDSLSGFFIISDEHLRKDEFAGITCFYLDQEEDETRLTPGDTVTLRVDILPKNYADFLENARHELGGANPIFGGPPANIETNITPKVNPNDVPVSGFFSAFSGRQTYRVYSR